jgi:hypothetical protein
MADVVFGRGIYAFPGRSAARSAALLIRDRQTPECGTIPGLQRITEEVLRCARDARHG